MTQRAMFVLLFFAMIGWGSSWVNVKVISTYINEFEMVFFRFSITILTMIPIMMLLKTSFRIDLKSFSLACIASIVLIIYMKYFFLGAKFGTASLGGAMVTTLIPIITFVMLAFMGLKTITRKDAIALCIGAIGVLTMLNVWKFNLAQILVPHNLYFLLAAILWPILTIISSKSTKVSPLTFTFYMYLVTIILVGVFFIEIEAIAFEHWDGIFWFNILFISVAGTTFANTIYFLGIEKLGAAEVSSFVFLVPFSAIILSAIFLKERIDLSIIIGTILTLFAVKLLNNITILKRRQKSV